MQEPEYEMEYIQVCYLWSLIWLCYLFMQKMLEQLQHYAINSLDKSVQQQVHTCTYVSGLKLGQHH